MWFTSSPWTFFEIPNCISQFIAMFQGYNLRFRVKNEVTKLCFQFRNRVSKFLSEVSKLTMNYVTCIRYMVKRFLWYYSWKHQCLLWNFMNDFETSSFAGKTQMVFQILNFLFPTSKPCFKIYCVSKWRFQVNYELFEICDLHSIHGYTFSVVLP